MKLQHKIVLDDFATKLHKNVSIATDGIYEYHISELEGMGLSLDSIPIQHKGRRFFKVYRPAKVLKDAKDLFVRLPLTREHPEVPVDENNFREFVIGWTGDSSEMTFFEEDETFRINSTLNIMDREGIIDYNKGVKEVSPGYDANFMWKDGKFKDDDFQIEMTKVSEVNHLALVDAGRGGKSASILDHKNNKEEEGEFEMNEKQIEGLFGRMINKMLGRKERVLDSIPKDGKFSEEQTQYILKEVANLLRHRASGGTFDSFYPEGFTKDDMPEPETKDSETVPDPKADEDKVDDSEPEDKVEDGDPEDKIEDSDPEDKVEDSPAEQSSMSKPDVEPTTVKSTSVNPSPIVGEPARTKDGKKIVDDKKKIDSKPPVHVKVADTSSKVVVDNPFGVADSVRNGFRK